MISDGMYPRTYLTVAGRPPTRLQAPQALGGGGNDNLLRDYQMACGMSTVQSARLPPFRLHSWSDNCAVKWSKVNPPWSDMTLPFAPWLGGS